MLCFQGWLGRSRLGKSAMHTLPVLAHGWDGQHVKSPSKSPGTAEWHQHSHWAIVSLFARCWPRVVHNTTQHNEGGGGRCVRWCVGQWQWCLEVPKLRRGTKGWNRASPNRQARYNVLVSPNPATLHAFPSRSRSSISIKHHHSKLHPSSISNSINLINKAKPLAWDPPSTAAPPTQGFGMFNLLLGGCNIHQAGTLQPPNLLRLVHCCVAESSSHSFLAQCDCVGYNSPTTHHTPHTTRTASFLR